MGIRKCRAIVLPKELESDKHLDCDERIIDVKDQLPKYREGVDDRLHLKKAGYD